MNGLRKSMKKLLGIVVLGLLLSSNTYAASEKVFIYLAHPLLWRIKSTGKYKDSELFKASSL